MTKRPIGELARVKKGIQETEKRRPKITRVYTRRYTDTGQVSAYVEWSDGTRTEGLARAHNCVPIGAHMQALFDRALREGLTIEREVW